MSRRPLLVLLPLLLAWTLPPAPSLPDPSPPAVPDVLDTTHRSGLRVLHAFRPGSGPVEVRLQWPLPPEAEPRKLAGVASVAMGLLRAGPKDDYDQEIALDLEARSPGWRIGVHDGWVELVFRCSPKHLEFVFRDLGRTLADPWVEAMLVASIANGRGQLLREEVQDDGAVARRMWFRLMLDDHPLGRSPHGTLGGLRNVSTDAVQEFLDRWITPSRGTLTVVGPVPPDELRDGLTVLTGRWRGPPATGGDRPLSLPTGASLVLLHRPGRVQSRVIAGFAAPPSTGEERRAQEVLADVLGTSLTGRLDRVLRVERGLTYGVGAWLWDHPGLTLLQVETSIDHARTAEGIQALMAEFASLSATAPTPDELSRVRRAAQGGVATALMTGSGVARALATELTAGRDPAQLGRRLTEAAAVTPEQVQAAAKALLRPGEIALVVVGDADTLEVPLTALGIPVRVVGR